jgi:hypothetical protein
MNITFRNQNGFDVFLCIDGKDLLIPPYASETVSRSDASEMTVVSRMTKPSYADKPKRSFWNFSFYHDYHLVLETDCRFCDVQNEDVFDIIAESTPLFDPHGVIYERCSIYPVRKTESSAQYRVYGDREALKKQYRRDCRKDGLFDFFVDPLIGFSADSCSSGCVSTILFWVAIIACVVNFGWIAVLQWGILIYLGLAVLEWLIAKAVDRLFSDGKTQIQIFDECFEPDAIKAYFREGCIGSQKKKKGFFGKIFGRRS